MNGAHKWGTAHIIRWVEKAVQGSLAKVQTAEISASLGGLGAF
jgi:hypothetical protein